MTARAGVLRSATGLAEAVRLLTAMVARTSSQPGTGSWETTNLLTVSAALAGAAHRRRETRGSHWREDHPHRDDGNWAGHLQVRLRDGRLEVEMHPGEPTDRAVTDPSVSATPALVGDGAP
jgi:L-aspartate oxidase